MVNTQATFGGYQNKSFFQGKQTPGQGVANKPDLYYQCWKSIHWQFPYDADNEDYAEQYFPKSALMSGIPRQKGGLSERRNGSQQQCTASQQSLLTFKTSVLRTISHKYYHSTS